MGKPIFAEPQIGALPQFGGIFAKFASVNLSENFRFRENFGKFFAENFLRKFSGRKKFVQKNRFRDFSEDAQRLKGAERRRFLPEAKIGAKIAIAIFV